MSFALRFLASVLFLRTSDISMVDHSHHKATADATEAVFVAPMAFIVFAVVFVIAVVVDVVSVPVFFLFLPKISGRLFAFISKLI